MREFEALARIAVLEVARDLVVGRPVLQALEDPPAQVRRPVDRFTGQLGDLFAHRGPGELRRLLDSQMRGHPEMGGEFQPQPLAEQCIGHDDPFRLERFRGMPAHLLGEPLRQCLQPMRRADAEGTGAVAGLLVPEPELPVVRTGTHA